AAKWITRFGSLEELIARADEVTGKVGQNFRDHLDDVLRNKRLNRLVTDVDLQVDVADLTMGDADRAAVDSLFDNLEFASNLRERLYAVLDFGEADFGGSEKPTEGFTVDVTVPEVGEVVTWIDEHLTPEHCAEQAPVGRSEEHPSELQ